MCIPAKTCRQALKEADFFWPNRNDRSDGICGDASHQARKSDHNQGNAFDLTHDPFNGLDTYSLARQLAMAKDPRVKYIISNGEIWNASTGKWKKYTGPNKHDHHMHVSIYDNVRNSTAGWWGRFMPKEIQMTKEEKDMLLAANHIVKVEYPKLKDKVLKLEAKVKKLEGK